MLGSECLEWVSTWCHPHCSSEPHQGPAVGAELLMDWNPWGMLAQPLGWLAQKGRDHGAVWTLRGWGPWRAELSGSGLSTTRSPLLPPPWHHHACDQKVRGFKVSPIHADVSQMRFGNTQSSICTAWYKLQTPGLPFHPFLVGLAGKVLAFSSGILKAAVSLQC